MTAFAILGVVGAAFLIWLAWPDTRSCQERNEDEENG